MYIQQKITERPAMQQDQTLAAIIIGCFASFFTQLKMDWFILGIPSMFSREGLFKIFCSLFVAAASAWVAKQSAHTYDRMFRPIQERWFDKIKASKWFKGLYKKKKP